MNLDPNMIASSYFFSFLLLYFLTVLVVPRLELLLLEYHHLNGTVVCECMHA